MIRKRKNWIAKPTVEGWVFYPPGFHTDCMKLRGKFTREQAREILRLVRDVYRQGKADKLEVVQRVLGIY